MKLVHAKCKELGITIGSVVMASQYFARQKYIFTQVTKEPLTKVYGSIDVDVNYRDRYPVNLGTKDIGSHFSVITVFFEFTKDTTFWGLAQEIYRQNTKNLKEGNHLIAPFGIEAFEDPAYLKEQGL